MSRGARDGGVSEPPQGLAVEDAWAEARATSRLSERDQDLLKAFVARASLIDAFSKDW